MTCFVVEWGAEGTGKTHFALTFPVPILLDNDRRYALTANKFKEARVVEVSVPVNTDSPHIVTAEMAWEDHKKQFSDACNNSLFKTVILDTTTTARQIALAATPKDEKRIAPYHYQWAHQELRELAWIGRRAGKHIIMVHRAGPEYINDARTEKEVLKGRKDIVYDADLVLYFTSQHRDVIAWIQKCGWTRSLLGVPLTNPTYSILMGYINDALKEEGKHGTERHS